MLRKGYKKSLALFLTFIMLLSIFNPFLVWAADDELQLDLISEGNEETVTEFINNDDELLSDAEIEDDELQLEVPSEGNEETVTEFINNDDELLSDIEIQSDHIPSIETTLTDMTTKSEIISFDLWVKDSEGQKIDESNVQVTINDVSVSHTWDDAEKTSYTFILVVGENHVKINVSLGGENYTREFTIIREEAEDGEVIGKITFSLEAFTIGLGYLIEPIQVDLRKGENAAQKLLEILDDNGYEYDHGGSVDSGFYFSRLRDGTNTIYKTTPSIPEALKEQLDYYDENNFQPGELGEFHFTFGSGWMFVVNNVFPNVGFADKYLLDEDVMRLQYTLAYGSDIGGAFPGFGENFFPTVNRDPLTKKVAEINSSENKEEYLSNTVIDQAYNDALEVLVKVDVSQEELDEALDRLMDAMEQPSTTPDLDKTALKAALAEASTKIETDYTEESYVALKAALEMPETTQREVDAKVLAINQAIEGLVAKQAKVDKQALESAITEAKANKASVVVSVDGKDVEPTQKWVTQEELTTYETAIAAAEQVYENSNAAQNEVDDAVSALSSATQVFHAAKKDGVKAEGPLTVKEQLNRNLAYLVNTVDNPTLGTLGGDWSILSLARGGYTVPEGYYDLYYSNVEKEVEKLMPASLSKPAGRLDRNKGTEHSRLILGLTSIGKDITNVAGYDLRTALADFDYVTRQGINGPIFGLIAFDSYNYEIPVDSNVTNQITREKMIKYILDKEIAGGGWALSGNTPDPDVTAMAIQALTPYYQSNSQVKASVDRAVTWLSHAQKADGGYSSWGTVNSESVAQVIVALTGLGIDPHTDPRFIKNGHSAVDNLMSFALPSGGFKHIKTGNADAMATDQGTYALVAYDRFVEGKNRLYDMTDIVMQQPSANKAILQSTINDANVNKDTVVVSTDGKDVDPTQKWVTQEEMTAYETAIATAQQVYDNRMATQDEVDNAVSALVSATETFNAAKKKGEKSVPTIPLPQPDVNGLVRIVIEANNKDDKLIPISSGNNDVRDVLVEIPVSNQGKIMVDLPSNEVLPRIEAVNGNVSVVFPQGVKVSSQDVSALELLTPKDANDASIISMVNASIPKGKKLEEILQVFTMGGSGRVEFSDFVTLTFKGMKGKEAAYIKDGKLSTITKFNSDDEGQKSGKLEYAYESGNDLIVKTKHFTDFITYTVGTDNTSGDGKGGGGPPLTRNTIILSIDKLTIDKGYVLPPTEVEFTPGESVWDVLQREMDKWGIPYTYIWTPKYNSVYVEWIAGDGEFDHGSGSGWMYNVNGWYPNYGASLYKLKNGDIVEWRYTTNLGADLGEDLSKWEIPGVIIPIIGGSIPAKEIVVDVNDKNPIINVPNNSDENYLITIPKKLRQTEKITINIPIENNNTWLNLEEVKDGIPLIEVRKDNKVLIFEKRTTLKTDQSMIQLFTQISDMQEELTRIINSHLVDEEASIIDAFEMGDSSSSTKFSQPITLRLEGEKGRHVGVIDHKGNWNPIKIYESEDKAKEAAKDVDELVYAFVEGDDLIIKTSHFSTFVLYTKETKVKDTNDAKVVMNRPLKDVYSDADQISTWAYDVIQEATELGFVEGYNGKIYPKNEITRAEFVRLMVAILGMDLESGNASVFPDVKEDDWFYSYVNTAYSKGLIAGYDDGNFHPNKNITREEMAAIIERILHLGHNPFNVVYQDHDQISEWAQNSVNSVSAQGMMVGYDDMFHPKDFVTREMAIAVAMRVYHFNNNQ